MIREFLEKKKIGGVNCFEVLNRLWKPFIFLINFEPFGFHPKEMLENLLEKSKGS